MGTADQRKGSRSGGSRVLRTDPRGSSNSDRGRHVRRRVRGGPSNPAVRRRYRGACYRRLRGRQSNEPVPYRTRVMLFPVRKPTTANRQVSRTVPIKERVLVDLIA